MEQACNRATKLAEAPDCSERHLTLAIQSAVDSANQAVMKAAMRALLSFKPRDPGDNPSGGITLVRALIRLYLKDMDVGAVDIDFVVREVLNLFHQAVEICRKLQEAGQLVVYAKDCAWLYKTAYNLALQGLSSWENTDSILTCFEVAVDLMRIYHNLQGVTADTQLPQQMLLGLHACLCGRVFAARSAENNEERTRLWQQARDILTAHQIALDNCPSPSPEIRAQAVILEVEILGSLNQWEEIKTLLQSTSVQGLPLQVCEAIADISFQNGTPITVTYMLQTLALKISTHTNQSGVVVLRWLRSMIDLLIHRKDTGDLENALLHIERTRDIAQSRLNEVRDSEELEWLLATSWNQGLDYINLSDIGHAKAWLEQAISFCSLLPNGEVRLAQVGVIPYCIGRSADRTLSELDRCAMYTNLLHMWAYKSYNDNAPSDDEPRFPPLPEPKVKTSLFSWTGDWYTKSKKAPIDKLTGLLATRRRKPAKSARSRRSSFVSSFFSTRQSNHDGRLDKIIKLLELLAEDKLRIQEDRVQPSVRSRTSSRGAGRSRMSKDHEDGDDDMSDDDDGDYRQSGRPSNSRRQRPGKSPLLRSHPHSALEATTEAGLQAALQNWRSKSSDGKTPGLKDRLKSSVKAGAIGAGKMGLRQIAYPSSRSRSQRNGSDEGSMESLDDKANPIISQLPALESMGKDRLDEMLKAAMQGPEKERPKKNDRPSVDGYQEPGHSRFRKEMLHYAEESPDLDEEDLLDGILPPVGRYDFDDSLEPLEKPKRPRKRRDDAQEDGFEGSRKADGKSRPLHFDPKASSSVQAFDWPDKEEISKTRDDKKTSRGKGNMMVMNDDTFVPEASKSRHATPTRPSRPQETSEDAQEMLRQLMQISGKDGRRDLTDADLRRLTKASTPEGRKIRHKTSSQRSQPNKDTGEDPEKLLRTLMQVPDEGGLEKLNKDDLRRLAEATRGHVPSPLDTMIKKGESSSRRPETSRNIGMRSTSQVSDDCFGIAWPTPPSHEPSDNETLPEYESPTMEAFRLNNQQRAPRPESLMQPQSTARVQEIPPTLATGRRNEDLFQRVLGTMLVEKSKDLAKKQQEYQGERLQPSTEQVILRIVGSWFMKQLPPLERANGLFSFADDDSLFEFLEELVKMSSLLGYPVLQRKCWDSDIYEHLQQEAESLQKCFLGVASVAVVKYLRHTSSDLTRDMPRILDMCYDMLKASPKDPSQVLAIIPKIRAQSKDSQCQNQRKALEADGLLDILYELATEFLAGDAPVSGSPDISSTTDATGESPMRPGSFSDTSERQTQTSVSIVSMEQEELGMNKMPKQRPINSSTSETNGHRGLAADFYEAPTPGPEGFSSAVLKDLEQKPEDASQTYRHTEDSGLNIAKETPRMGLEKKRSMSSNKEDLSRPGEQQMEDSLLMMERPRQVKEEATLQVPQNSAPIEPEGRNSSSSSEEECHSGLDATSILPTILRKKLEGKKRSTPKLANASKLGILGTLTEEGPLQEVADSDIGKRRRIPTKTRSASSARSPSRTRAIQSIARRVPGSYFPPADDMVKAVGTGDTVENQPRLRPGPIVTQASIYTPATASPLRASMSALSPEASTRSSAREEIQLQRPTATVSSPTGVVFANPFSGDTTHPADSEANAIATPASASATIPVYTAETITRPDPAMTSPKASLVEAIQDYADDEMIFLTPMASPTLAQDVEILADAAETSEEEATDVSDTSDSASIGSNEMLTSEDIRAGVLRDHDMEALVDHGPEPLTEAEKDLAAREPEALVPGPRGVITSQDVRNHSVSFNDFSRAYTGAVPRVEVTPGAIQNTQGEIIPIDDEDIHLEAGETLIDGTGRVWNSKGLIEPGRDDQGKTILYAVDIAQIKRANNGVMPAMMPWDDDEWMDDEPGTPSYDPDDDTVSAVSPASSMDSSMFDTPRGRAGRLRGSQRRESDLDRIDDQLGNAVNPAISEYDEYDEPLDEMDMQAEEERINAEEEADMIRASVNEQKKMGLI
ncbi:hypothetical protein QFC22_005224 [Naganishia vaughanmartiniae]|uniref:Uncharacterized protein n=1 Tax=Naganishia vaughanmartiniae TaxID=1424756 RepID=A0ACC2WXD3_9TREE|nr:hypothetical protein QFC22_005224 [Naganishia vaughanmartiniae]